MTVREKMAGEPIAATAGTPPKPRFHETAIERLRRWSLGTLYALRPRRVSLVPRLLLLSLAHLFAPETERDKLPEHAVFYGKRGLVGISNDLSLQALIENYRRGYYPIRHVGAMKWWSPEERAIIDPAATHVSKNLLRLLRQGRFKVTFDQNFAGVIAACARPRPGKMPLTWITPDVMEAYCDAHHAGYAHSVEVWNEQGALVGGLYGLAIGAVFFGESQFALESHMSKVALVALHRHLRHWGFRLRDGKAMTPHLASFGFRNVPRFEFQIRLRRHIDEPGKAGLWTADPTLDLTEWPKSGETAGAQRGALIPPHADCA